MHDLYLADIAYSVLPRVCHVADILLSSCRLAVRVGAIVTRQDFQRIMAHAEVDVARDWSRFAEAEFHRLDTDFDGYLSMDQCYELIAQVKPIKVR